MAGKGSWRRRSNVPKKIVDENWDNIFGKKDKGAKKDVKKSKPKK